VSTSHLRALQAFRFGSFDFVADCLSTLRLREEATPLTLLEGDTPSNGPLADLDTEALMWCIELMLSANPSESNVDLLLFSLRNVFHQLSRGISLSPPHSAQSVPVWPHKRRECLRKGAPEGPTIATARHRIREHDGVQSCLAP
jgi:hypothetical protein